MLGIEGVVVTVPIVSERADASPYALKVEDGAADSLTTAFGRQPSPTRRDHVLRPAAVAVGAASSISRILAVRDLWALPGRAPSHHDEVGRHAKDPLDAVGI